MLTPGGQHAMFDKGFTGCLAPRGSGQVAVSSRPSMQLA